MTDHLDRLAARAVGALPLLAPLPRARFADDDGLTEVAVEADAPFASPTRAAVEPPAAAPATPGPVGARDGVEPPPPASRETPRADTAKVAAPRADARPETPASATPPLPARETPPAPVPARRGTRTSAPAPVPARAERVTPPAPGVETRVQDREVVTERLVAAATPEPGPLPAAPAARAEQVPVAAARAPRAEARAAVETSTGTRLVVEPRSVVAAPPEPVAPPPAPEPASPVVEVTIGRIDVAALPLPSRPVAPAAPPRAAVGPALDAYLAEVDAR